MKLFLSVFMSAVLAFGVDAQIRSVLTVKTPGNPAHEYELADKGSGILKAEMPLPVEVRRVVSETEAGTKVEVYVKANADVWFNLSNTYQLNANHADCEFYMPGFWYHKNLRSPKEAPSFHTSDSWEVREDRLSTPMTGVYNPGAGEYYTVMRETDENGTDCVCQNISGDILLPGHTTVGSVGFRNVSGKSALVFSYPYTEAPTRYIRKLTLIPGIRSFVKLAKGEIVSASWLIAKGAAADFSDFVAKTWTYSYDRNQPKPVATGFTQQYAKDVLSNFYVESFVDKYPLKYFSGEGIRTAKCELSGEYQIGFVGRSLLNAFNALEYAEANNRADIERNARAVIDSHITNGFSASGLFYESGNLSRGEFYPALSIRRQSEGVYALLYYLDYEKRRGRKHTDVEKAVRTVLDALLTFQRADGSFPRKFNADGKVVDASGGSTPAVTVPLVMAYRYFGDAKYLESAKLTLGYLEREIIDKADYFSSTLDANCEDKEAALAAATATYYMTFVTKGEERAHYVAQCLKSTYFCLSWYYTWDVPFAQGQMLGDLGFHSRGWGNVSVENNHIDVFVFEFASILDFLKAETGETRFADFAEVIRTSMLQLLPFEGHMCGIAKAGYYPEVVQHTTWDYGRNGKGFYNNIFAPGWTVPSLWQMMSPERVPGFFSDTKKHRK